MKKTFEKTLPDGYKEIFTVDAKSAKTAVTLNLLSVVLALLIAFGGLFLLFKNNPEYQFAYALGYAKKYLFLFAIVLLAYIVLHEIVHGLAYKLLTHEKLKFGLTLSVAYCGVPDIYVYRTTALISLLAPFTVFSIAFLVPIFFISDFALKEIFIIWFALHFGGCIGDLYDTMLYLIKFRSPDTLMIDNGPKQIFYVK